MKRVLYGVCRRWQVVVGVWEYQIYLYDHAQLFV